MPTIDMHILRAWRHRKETGRIHYIQVVNGVERHLYVDEGSPLYDVLDGQLKAIGYAGPKAA